MCIGVELSRSLKVRLYLDVQDRGKSEKRQAKSDMIRVVGKILAAVAYYITDVSKDLN